MGPAAAERGGRRTHERLFSDFTAALRIEANVGERPFLAMNELMGKVGALMAEIATLKTRGPISGLPSAKRLRLRETDPWGSMPIGR